MSPRPETPRSASDHEVVALLTERVVLATGAGNLTHLALSPALLARAPAQGRRALELRLGLDRIREGVAAGPRTAEKVAAALGVDRARAEALIDEAARALASGGGRAREEEPMATTDDRAPERGSGEGESERPAEDATPDPGQDRSHRFSGDDESREGAAGASETRTPGMGS